LLQRDAFASQQSCNLLLITLYLHKFSSFCIINSKNPSTTGGLGMRAFSLVARGRGCAVDATMLWQKLLQFIEFLQKVAHITAFHEFVAHVCVCKQPWPNAFG
jgi:hypothetical protein